MATEVVIEAQGTVDALRRLQSIGDVESGKLVAFAEAFESYAARLRGAASDA